MSCGATPGGIGRSQEAATLPVLVISPDPSVVRSTPESRASIMAGASAVRRYPVTRTVRGRWNGPGGVRRAGGAPIPNPHVVRAGFPANRLGRCTADGHRSA
ncbi:hypothetical protein Nm8I071_28190 [Nonomuraea sp. TT08I-71]|nr:hypothetical protein Nm8I071_28190 [Nonomuraea sp. TT08I-71]